MLRVIESVPSMETTYRRYNLTNSAAIIVGDLVLVDGLTAVDYDSGEVLSGGDFRFVAERAIDVVRRVLGDIDGDLALGLDHVVKVNAFVPHPANFPVWNETFLAAFQPPYPCRTTVCSPLAFGDIELDVTASLIPRRT